MDPTVAAAIPNALVLGADQAVAAEVAKVRKAVWSRAALPIVPNHPHSSQVNTTRQGVDSDADPTSLREVEPGRSR